MNKFHIIIFLIIIGIFGLIIYSTQKGGNTKTDPINSNLSPNITPSDELEFFSKNSIDGKALAENQQKNKNQNRQQAAPGIERQGPVNASVSATISTSKGDIDVVLFGKEAQKTVINFITKANGKFFNNLTFHRVEDWVIQGGDPSGTGTGGGAIQTELNSEPFVIGSIGMAASSQMQMGQGARISNDSQFFIVKNDADWLNGQYTNFGRVVNGMDVVNKIKIGDKILGVSIN